MPAHATQPDVVCPRHHASPLRTHCRDCGVGMCDDCAIGVPGLGQFCWECATRRGGLQHRPRPRRNGANGATHEPPPEPPDPPAPVFDLLRERFDAAVDVREPEPPPTGLSQRLEAAGVDPGAAVDPGELLGELGRLQARAAEADPPTRWWRRRGQRTRR